MSKEHLRQCSYASKTDNFRAPSNVIDKSEELKQQFHHWKVMTQQIEQDFYNIAQQREAKAKDAMLQNAVTKKQQAHKIAQHLDIKRKEVSQIKEEKDIISKELQNKQKQLRDVTERIIAEIKANELGLKKLTIQNIEPSKWIKHKEECINALESIRQQTTNTLMHAKSEREIINNSIYESASDDVCVFNKAIAQLEESNKQIEQQKRRFIKGISSMVEIIAQSREEYNMNMEDLSSHLIQRAEKVVLQEELDDLYDAIKKKNKSDDYDCYALIANDNGNSYSQQYERIKEKLFCIELLKQAPQNESIHKMLKSIRNEEFDHPISELESLLKVSLTNHFTDYSSHKNKSNQYKAVRESEVMGQLNSVVESIKRNINIVDSLILPQIKAYEETISNCLKKKEEMEIQFNTLKDAGDLLNNQLSELNEKKRHALMHSSKRIEAEKDLYKLDKKIKEMEEEEISKKREIEELRRAIGKSHKEKEQQKTQMQVEEQKINSVIAKLYKELANAKDTIGRDIKLLTISLQQKETAVQALQEGFKNTTAQYSSAIESYKFAQSALNSRDMNQPLKANHTIRNESGIKYSMREYSNTEHCYSTKKSVLNESIKNEVLKDDENNDFIHKLSSKSRSKRNSSLAKSTRGNTKSVSNVSYFSTINSASIKKSYIDAQ